MTPFVKKVYDNIHRQSLLARGSRVLVAVSGGADSVALLLALDALKHDLGLSISVAHYNHALRTSAVQDQKFVERLSRKLGFSFITETNRKKTPRKGSLEEYARTIRYAFLLKIARRMNIDAVAVAHTKDDLAETVLMRILRGTGLSGLRSMAPKHLVDDVLFIRPFLNIFRSEIERFLKSQRASFVHDPTNRSLKFRRNQIRLKLIPYIEKEFTPDVKERLTSLANIAAVEHDFIDIEGRAAWQRLVKIKRGKAVIKNAEFQALHPALRRIVLRMVVTALKGVEKSWDLRHMDMVDAFVRSKVFGYLSLPEGFVLHKVRGIRTFVIQIS